MSQARRDAPSKSDLTGRQTMGTHCADRVQRRSVRTLILAQVIGGVGVGAGASTSAILAEAVMRTETLAGVARTSTELGGAVAAVPLALLAARRGRRFALTIGWVGAGIGALLLVIAASSGNGILLVGGFLLFGVGKAVNLQSRYAATDLSRPGRHGRDLSIVLWSTTVGAVLGPNLIAPGQALGARLGIPGVGGAYLFSAVACLAGAAVMFGMLRPDPLILRRSWQIADCDPPDAEPTQVHTHSEGMWVTFRIMMKLPTPRLGFWMIALGQSAMAALMTMTPVHMDHLEVGFGMIGLTISAHVFGMYGLSPVVGKLSDLLGPMTVAVAAPVFFVASAIVAGCAQSSVAAMMAALFILGLGWSCALIAGTTLMTSAAPDGIRVQLQGLSDMTMSLCGAVVAGVAGLIMWWFGFGGLNITVGLLTVPVWILFLTQLKSSGRAVLHGDLARRGSDSRGQL